MGARSEEGRELVTSAVLEAVNRSRKAARNLARRGPRNRSAGGLTYDFTSPSRQPRIGSVDKRRAGECAAPAPEDLETPRRVPERAKRIYKLQAEGNTVRRGCLETLTGSRGPGSPGRYEESTSRIARW